MKNNLRCQYFLWRNIMKLVLLLYLFVIASSQEYDETDSEYWYHKGAQELSRAMTIEENVGVAKNIIVFLGDGMGISTLTAARILKGQKKHENGEGGRLVFEDFPHVALVKTYSVDTQVSDSASTATAFLSGVKTNQGVLGYNAKVKRGDCESTDQPGVKLSTIAEWAMNEGKHVGLVTTARVTHATPAALYAKSADRDWECHSGTKCEDIATQLINGYPGNQLKVILGGGRQAFTGEKKSEDMCHREDGKHLIKKWLEDKKRKKYQADYVETAEQLRNVNVKDTEYLMGLFAESHLPYELLRDESVPSLTNMTHTALRILNKNENGYVLLVEGGRIDHAHHANLARLALEETLEFDGAVEAALGFVDIRDTLVIVTADHSHGMTMSGYPPRGNPILGFAGYSGPDKLPYTTLSYASGPGAQDTYIVKDGKVVRKDLSGTNTSDPNFVSQAMVYLSADSHSGEDVAVYAKGPMAFLFHSLHEQNYIAHVISFASCIGPVEKVFCQIREPRSKSHTRMVSCQLTTTIAAILIYVFVLKLVTME